MESGLSYQSTTDPFPGPLVSHYIHQSQSEHSFHSGETNGTRSDHTLHPHTHTLYWLFSQRGNFVSGVGGLTILGHPWMQTHSPHISWSIVDICHEVTTVTTVFNFPTTWWRIIIKCLSTLLPLKVPLLQLKWISPMSSGHSGMYSAYNWLPSFHLIGHGAVPSSCCL